MEFSLGGFITEQIGFIDYPFINEGYSNFYRTEDGDKSLKKISCSLQKSQDGLTLIPFVQPEDPYYEGNQLILLVGQESERDVLGGRLMAKLTSEDLGKIWTFVGDDEREVEVID